MRLKLFVLSLALYLAMTLGAHAVLPSPAVTLDVAAQALPDGDLITWYNGGYAGGHFDARGLTPQVGWVAGKRAVTFTGMNGYRSNFILGEEFGGSSPYTVSYTCFNPSLSGTERLIGWTLCYTPNFMAAIFGYGTDANYGAVNHWGTNNDMGFDRGVPAINTWHNITVTYSGISGIEKVWVDGVIQSYEKKPDNQLNQIQLGDPLTIACFNHNDASTNFSGSVAAIKIYPAEATYQDVLDLGGYTVMAPGTQPTVVNGSFEYNNSWYPIGPAQTFTTPGSNRIIPGWATSEAWIPGSPVRGQIGNQAANFGLSINAGPWDNGMAKDGTRVLTIAAEAANANAASQWISCRGGRPYHIRIYANAFSGGDCIMTVRMNGTQVGTPMNIYPVESAGSFASPFWEWNGNWTAPSNGCFQLEIEQSKFGVNNILLVDQVLVFDSDAQLPIQMPDVIDFGTCSRNASGNANRVDKVVTIRNTGSRNLNLTNRGTTGTDSVNLTIVGTQPGTTNGVGPNIVIEPYDTYDMTFRFTAGTAVKSYGGLGGTTPGTMWIDWGNGRYSTRFNVRYTAVVPSEPIVLNGSFEENYIQQNSGYQPFNWYNQQGDTREIPHWLDKGDTGIGVQDRASGNWVNQGTIPDGRNALYIQTLPGYYPRQRSVSQVVGGWDKTKTYRLSLWANSRSSNYGPALLSVKVGGTLLTPKVSTFGSALTTISGTTATVNAVNAAWYNLYYDVIPGTSAPTNPQYSVELISTENTANAAAYGKYLNVDNVQIWQVGGVKAGYVPCLATGGLRFSGNVGVMTGNQSVRIMNVGASDLTVRNFSIVGQNHLSFIKRSNEPSGAGQVIPPFGGFYDFAVAMKAQEPGEIASAALQFNADDTTGTYTVPLSGVGYNYPNVVNGSFEEPLVFWDDNETWRNLGTQIVNVPGGVRGWSLAYWQNGAINSGVTDRFGISRSMTPTSTQDYHVDNGLIARGVQAAWLQTGESGNSNNSMKEQKCLRNVVQGFTNGLTYHVKALVNARNQGDNTATWALIYWPWSQGTPNPPFAPANTLVANNDITAVDGPGVFTTPYREFTADFVSTYTGAYTFQFFMDYQYDDSSLLIDALEISGDPPNAIKHWSLFE